MKLLSSVLKSLTRRSSQKGFSLIEIIIVIAIIAILIGIIVTRIAGGNESAKASLAGTTAGGLYGKILQYQLQNPSVTALPTEAELIAAGVATHEEYLDPWGNPLCLAKAPDGSIVIGSLGGKAAANQGLCFIDGKKVDKTVEQTKCDLVLAGTPCDPTAAGR